MNFVCFYRRLIKDCTAFLSSLNLWRFAAVGAKQNRILDGYFKPFKIYGHLLGSKFKALSPYLNTSDRLLKLIFMRRDFKANFTKI